MLPKEKHPVNVLFSKADYAKLVRRATELTLREGRRVSVAELVRRLALSKDDGFRLGTEATGIGVSPD